MNSLAPLQDVLFGIKYLRLFYSPYSYLSYRLTEPGQMHPTFVINYNRTLFEAQLELVCREYYLVNDSQS